MKPLTQLGIGVCGGALAALLYHTYSISSFAPSAFAPEVLASESISRNLVPARAGSSPTDAPRATNDAARASDSALLDPTSFFENAERASEIDELLAGLEILIAVDPARVFDIVSKFNSRGNAQIDALYLRAITGMASRDPRTAIARLQGVANGPQRDPILVAIAAGYARVDPDATLQWATSVVPLSPDAVDSVLTTAATRDLLHAYELLQQAQGRVSDITLVGSAIARAALSSGQAMGPLASALAPNREPGANAILGAFLQGWMGREPQRTVAWMAENEGYLTNELTRSAVFYLAFEDVEVAAELTERVPASAQDQWLSEVALRYGQFDIEKALAWLPRYRNRASYRELLSQTLFGGSRMSVSLPSTETVARFIATAQDDVDENIVSQAAYAYGGLDPRAAVRWALDLAEPQRIWAVSAVVDAWAQRDGPAAQRWAIEQPRGALRDEILGTILEGALIYNGVDPRALVEGVTSQAAAQESIYQFIVRDVVNRRDVTAASRAQVDWMLERLTDPDLRRQADERIAAAAQ
jgi:hypothetical protein